MSTALRAARRRFSGVFAVLSLAACGPEGRETDARAADVGPGSADGGGVDGGVVVVPPRPGLACTEDEPAPLGAPSRPARRLRYRITTTILPFARSSSMA